MAGAKGWTKGADDFLNGLPHLLTLLATLIVLALLAAHGGCKGLDEAAGAPAPLARKERPARAWPVGEWRSSPDSATRVVVVFWPDGRYDEDYNGYKYAGRWWREGPVGVRVYCEQVTTYGGSQYRMAVAPSGASLEIQYIPVSLHRNGK